MANALVTQCLLQGICICASYYYPDAKLEGDSCLGSVPTYQQFGTLTDYNVVIKPYLNETTEPISVPDGCRPSLFYLFQRHTLRYPPAAHIQESHVLLRETQRKLRDKRRKSKMCNTDVEAILAWESTFFVENGHQVTAPGEAVVRQQVQRLRTRFPSVFGHRDKLERLVVDFSPKGNRTRDTAHQFLQEWFGQETFQSKVERLANVNNITVFHSTCKAIMKNHGVTVTSPNSELLLNGKLYKKFKKTLEKRLGFDISTRHVKAILRQCRYEVTTYGASPWCALVGEEELRFAELLDDASVFDQDSYGQSRNKMAACPVAIDILQQIRNLTQEDVELPKVVLRFSHDGAIKRIVTLLGLGRSEEPALDCRQRSWWSHRWSPFNANVNVVHFSCPKPEQNRVALLINEKLEHLPGCKEQLCTVKEVEDLLQPKADRCDLETICSN